MLLSQKIKKMYKGFQTAHQKHKAWQRVVTILACFVVFCTTYALILPAITMDTTADPNAIFCGNEAHRHGENCYNENQVLICTSAEHQHSLACYSNPKADLENDAHWKKLASTLNLANVWSRDLVNMALSQRDYSESDRNYLVAEDGSRHGYTRYGDWNGDKYGDWNTAFVGWCLKYAGISETYIPYSAKPTEWLSLLKERKLFQGTSYVPQKGDLAFLDTDRDGKADRVGIITDSANNGVSITGLTVIEGDNNKVVAQTEYRAEAVSIVGYGQLAPAYQQYLDDYGFSDPKEYDVPIYTDQYYATLAEDDTVITMEGVLPLDAKPRAYPVEVSISGKDVVCSYDISIWLNDGTLYEPEQYITVSIEQTDIPDSSAVYYVPEEGEPEKMTSRPESDGVSFDAGHFSVYAVVETAPEKVENLNEKPTSGAATGWIKNFVPGLAEIRGNYASDKVTANIESNFAGVLADDGKLLTDKSVLYNNNDYYTFNNYGSDEFSVTLSALAQQYAESYEIKDKAPIDVVMILDISGSMEEVGTNNEKRIDVATNAINYFINNLMLLHPENRVGIVMFSNNAKEYLPLGRYYVGSGTPTYSADGTVPSYLECTPNACTVSNAKYSGVSTNDSLKRVTTDGKGNYVSSQAVSRVAFGVYGGTYTQSGIAQAAKMFLEQENLTYTAKTGDVLRRMPVTLLLSDGEPTYCTSNYTDVLNGTIYGNGAASTTDNPQGIQGYYTILSANYYKQQIANHYQYKNTEENVASFFYSVGMGINSTGVTAAGGNTSSGDHYKRAVLNPHPEGIALLTDTSAKNYRTNALQLYNLLRNSYSDQSVTVGAQGYNPSANNGYTFTQSGKTPQSKVPVVDNPYTTDYAYADNGFFSSEYSKLELAEVMDTIMVNMINNETYVKSFYDNVSDLNFYDVIGNGMELSSDFILRYNGLDYAMSLVSTEGNVKKYQYTGTATVSSYFGATVQSPLNQIWVEVTTATDGTQTVHWFIPATLVPELAYYQGMSTTDYYQMYPVRLIYKVGLTETSKNAVAALREGDAPLVFYTNAWNGASTTTSFCADEHNPFYKNNISLSETKENNVTGTRDTYFESQGKQNITNTLGNNGKLVFEYKTVVPDTEGEKTNFKVNKVWSDGNENHADESVTVQLLTDGAVYTTTTLNADNNWAYIWENIPKYYTNGESIDYTVKEGKIPGYQAVIGALAVGSFESGSYSWNNITSFATGDTVRIVYNNQALTNTTGSILSMVALNANDKTQQWVLEASGNNFALKNKSTGRYLYASRSGSSYTVSASTSTHPWNLQKSGSNLLLQSSSLSRNLRITTSSISMNSSGTAIQPQALEPVMMDGISATITNSNLEASSITELVIEKEWLNGDGSPDTTGSHEDITVTLYADGEEYRTITLSADTDWKTTVSALPVAWMATPDTPINWTFKESQVEGYLSVFGVLEKTSDTNTVFRAKTEFTNSNIFYITDSNGNALTASGTSLTTSAKNQSNTYQQWIAESYSGYFALKNVGTNTYLYVTSSGSWNATYSLGLSSSKQAWAYTNDNRLQNRSYSSRYLSLGSGSPSVTTSGATITLGQYEEETISNWYLPLINRAGMEFPSTGGSVLFLYILSGLVALTGCLIYRLSRKRSPERRSRE